MKFKLILIVSCLIIINIVNAQRYDRPSAISVANRRVQDIPKIISTQRPVITTTRRVPNNRPRPSIFPKNPKKFMVTDKPIATARREPVTRRSVMKPLKHIQRPITENPKNDNNDASVNNIELTTPINIGGAKDEMRVNEKINKPNEEIVEEVFLSEEQSLGQHSFENLDNKAGKEPNPYLNEDDIQQSMLRMGEAAENIRRKRLTIGFLVNNLDKKQRTYSEEQANDENEFIFMREDKKKPIEHEVERIEVIEATTGYDGEDITTDYPEEPKGKAKRSVNIIEEENLGTTVTGFKFTGRDSQLSNDLAFKNINA